MAWLAVDKNGTEVIYRREPVRKDGYFAPTYNELCEYASDFVVLPKGSIKKLIGREMKWEDEPVELV